MRKLIFCLLLLLLLGLAGCAPSRVDFGLVGASRSLAAPEPPVLSSAYSTPTNVVCAGDCVLGGDASWVTSDFFVYWTHADPLSVDDYEVWRSVMEPYFEPETCTACELATTTSGLQVTIADSPTGFNPVGGTAGADICTDIDFYLIRARNAGGVSASSNRIGVVHFSMLQGSDAPPLPFP